MNERIEEFFKYNTDKDGITKFYNCHYYIQRPDKIKSLEKIQTADIAAFTEIEHLKNLIEILKLYRIELYNRFQEINTANYHKRITIERQPCYYQNKIFYYVYVENVPDRDDVEIIKLRFDKYTGKERHKALELFNILCKQYPRAEKIKKIQKNK